MRRNTGKSPGQQGTFMWGVLLALLGLLFLSAGCHAGEERSATPPAGTGIGAGGPWAKMQNLDSFTFVVVGDTRTGWEVFKEIIGQINLLAPDFAIDVGDLIGGYTDDMATIEAMWNEFDEHISLFTVPLVMVVGNHDVWNLMSRRMYERRYGPTYFSFDHKGVHFIVLDSEAMDEEGKLLRGTLGEAQLKWLQADLQAHESTRLKFAFLHKPKWRGSDDETKSWMAQVHPLLARYGVDAVFAGHDHVYLKSAELNRVKYYVTGGGGAELAGTEETGGFHHFVFVTVRGDEWHMAVVPMDEGVQSEDVITEEAVQQLRVLTAFCPLPTVEIADKPGEYTLEIPLRNRSEEPINVRFTWRIPKESRWNIQPRTAEADIVPHAHRTLKFTTTVDPEAVHPAPVYHAQLRCGSLMLVDGEFELRVKSLRQTVCMSTDAPPKVDGKLDDPCWAKARPTGDFVALRTGLPIKTAQTKVMALYDPERLYVAVVCDEPEIDELKADATERDGPVFSDDEIELFFDTNLDRHTFIQVIVNSLGTLYDSRRQEGDGAFGNPKWNGNWEVKTSRGEGSWAVELAVDFKELGAAPPKPGEVWGFNSNRARYAGKDQLSSWSLCYKMFLEPENFGRLIFSANHE